MNICCADFQCNCRYKKCSTVTTEECKKKQYEELWKLGHFNAQNYKLLHCIKVFPEKSQRIRYANNCTKSQPKQCSREYKINEIPVCKKVFEVTFGVSSGRINRILAKKQEHSMMPTDQMGEHKNHSHMTKKIKKSLCKLIDRIPKHKSHYKDNSKVKYLSPAVHKIGAYELWTEECKTNELSPVPSYEWFLVFWKKKL